MPTVTVHIMLVCLPPLFISRCGHCPCLHGERLSSWALSLVALQLQLSVMRIILVCAAIVGSEGGRVVGTAGGRVGVVKEGREVRVGRTVQVMGTVGEFSRSWVIRDVHYTWWSWSVWSGLSLGFLAVLRPNFQALIIIYSPIPLI